MIGPIVINGDVWRPQVVDPGDPRLRDRTGSTRIATTDPSTRHVYLSRDLHRIVPEESWVDVEEWACNFLANYGREVVQAVNAALPRPVALAS